MTDDTSVRVLKALADPARLDMVRTLVANGGQSSCSLVSMYSSLSQPAISHHFGKLVDAGVLTDHKDGVQKYYKVNFDLLASLGIDIYKL
jgi:ArsR family transcriptional regulator, arsenate/arsenite/antimonite-responsive transcriptional repressor